MRLSQRENLIYLDIWWRTIEVSLFEITSMKKKKIISKDKAAIIFKADEFKVKQKQKQK